MREGDWHLSWPFVIHAQLSLIMYRQVKLMVIFNWLLFQSHVNNIVVFSYSWRGKRMLFLFHSTIDSYQYYLLSDPVLSLDFEF